MLTQIQLAGKTNGLKFIHAMKAAVAAIHKVVKKMLREINASFAQNFILTIYYSLCTVHKAIPYLF